MRSAVIYEVSFLDFSNDDRPFPCAGNLQISLPGRVLEFRSAATKAETELSVNYKVSYEAYHYQYCTVCSY
jgi:hypothetical protein